MKRTQYKLSRFNYVTQNQSGVIIYNTLYNSLTRLSYEEYERISGDQENDEFIQKLVDQGILVKANCDELEQYNLYTYYANTYVKTKPHLTITPTMECNARCFYCYENGVRCGKMSKDKHQEIIEFLRGIDCSQGIDLTWFGGEPLLNQKWMDEFVNHLESAGIEFSAFMITNGSKIDDFVIGKMKNKWKINSVQITLDGCYEEYSLRKSYVDQDDAVYYKILKIIGKLADAGIEVQVRMNVDGKNQDSVLHAVEDIATLFSDKHRVKCYPAFLSGVKNTLTEREKIDFIKKMIEQSSGKFDVNECLYRLPKTRACYFNQKDAFSIDTNGNVYACEHMLGHEERAIGNISQKIVLPDRELSGKRDECQQCIFLPKCQGGCWDTHQNGEISCFTDKYIIMAYLEML